MSILINKDTKVITQGITGKTGQFHTRMCRDYANGRAAYVAGVNPKRAGEDFEGIPIFATVKDAKQKTGATVSVIYVPPAGAADAIREAVDRVNGQLSVIEKVRKFDFADEPFTIENEQMTPSMKIRRHILRKVYEDKIAALYKG